MVVVTEIEPYTHARLSRYGLGAFLRRELDRAGVRLTEEQRAALTEVARDAVVDPIGANEVLSYIGNVMAGRVSSRWNLTGPSFTVSGDGAGLAEALQVARLLLLDPDLEAVLVGAVDLAGSAELLLTRPELSGEPGLSFDQGGRGRRVGEGAGALVVTRADSAPGRVHARIDGLAVRYAPASGSMPDAVAAPLAEAAEAALAEAGVAAAEVGYLEAHAGGTAEADRTEIDALARVYRADAGATALGSVKAQLGDAGCAAGVAGLIRTVLCLRQAYLPGTRGWRRPEDDLADAFAASAFYVPDASRPWLRERADSRRRAAVSIRGASGSHAHVVLSSVPGAERPRPTADWSRAGGPVLLAVAADTPDGLVAEAGRYRALLADGADPRALAREAADGLDGRRLRIVLVGRDHESLLRQLELAIRDVPGAHAEGREWATPAGSFFTPRPLGPEGRVALVYPGAFNSYPGLGADLFRAFPSLLDRFERQAAEPARMLRAAQLYPRTLEALDRRGLMRLEESLGDDVPFMLATGTSFAILYTTLVREVLGITAHGGFGYSLGESSMLFATGGWDPAGRSDSLISDSPIFRNRLCGPRRTVRDLWGLPEETPDGDVWASHVLLTSAEPVREALARYDRVHLTHVNTPRELVIAGDPAQCRALIEELGCPAARSPVNVVMHCPVVDPEFDGLARMNDYPMGSFGDLELFSAYDYQPLPAELLAESPRRIAHTLRSTIDFPRLVHAAYERGYRYFIEVGPGATCSRWIRDTLGDAPHVAACVDRRGVPATTPLAHLTARLAGHGLPVNLTALQDPAPAPSDRPARRLLRSDWAAASPSRPASPARRPRPWPTSPSHRPLWPMGPTRQRRPARPDTSSPPPCPARPVKRPGPSPLPPARRPRHSAHPPARQAQVPRPPRPCPPVGYANHRHPRLHRPGKCPGSGHPAPTPVDTRAARPAPAHSADDPASPLSTPPRPASSGTAAAPAGLPAAAHPTSATPQPCPVTLPRPGSADTLSRPVVTPMSPPRPCPPGFPNPPYPSFPYRRRSPPPCLPTRRWRSPR
ncbi:beta-ketoacyl synthase N-terminal-like domain-containing protein [Streptomyces diastatochromogenes]|nr:beta-ketoacyl synthase N-terminal-like domain-containing protein [Streptomyces diastatochromogenes]